MAKIVFENVTKSFPRKPGQRSIRSAISDARKRTNFCALENVSFSIRDGESVALIGRNGAGKSTTLNLIAGLMFPNAGSVHVEGRVAALLELGAGFHPELTGRENLAVNAALLGLSRRQVKHHAAEIIEFAGLGEFIDQPLRTYSAGMSMRLAFSIAVSVNPDIILVDEVLAVGDASFQARCIERIMQLRKSGKVFVFVSHNMAIHGFCDTALWLDQGKLLGKGPITDTLAAYSASLSNNVEIRPDEEAALNLGATTHVGH